MLVFLCIFLCLHVHQGHMHMHTCTHTHTHPVNLPCSRVMCRRGTAATCAATPPPPPQQLCVVPSLSPDMEGKSCQQGVAAAAADTTATTVAVTAAAASVTAAATAVESQWKGRQVRSLSECVSGGGHQCAVAAVRFD
jgi:hypothetical protein